jgi:hypothetical protein
MRLIPTAALLGAVLLAAAPGRADEDPKLRAQKLFQQGLAAMDSGDAAGGCGMLRQSLGLFAVPNTLFLVAQCDEQEGKLGTALEHWKRGLSLIDAKDKRAAKAKERIAALDAKAPRLRVVLPTGQAPKLTLDGSELDPAALEAPLVLDPGKHALVVRAPGREDRTHEVTLAAGERTEIVAALGPVASGPTAPPKGEPPKGEPPKSEPPKSEPPKDTSAGSGLRTGGYVTLGLAGAAFVVAGITGGMILSHKSEAEDPNAGKCSATNGGAPYVCHPDYASSLQTAKNLLAPNTIAWGVGLAAAATGAALVIVGVRAGKTSPVTAAPLVTRDGGGVWLTGRF